MICALRYIVPTRRRRRRRKALHVAVFPLWSQSFGGPADRRLPRFDDPRGRGPDSALTGN